MHDDPLTTLRDLVDLQRYALDEPDSPAWRDAVARVRADLERDGCSVLADFIAAARRPQLEAECAALESQAHFPPASVNAYNIDAAGLPPDHPAHIAFERGNAFVARDQIPPEHLIQRLYVNEIFQRFLADCFGAAELHVLADPFAGLCVNVLPPGHEHPWHFDINEFTVSLLTRPAQSGGAFTYHPWLRSPENENAAAVAAILRNESASAGKSLQLRCGDLQLFCGRYALHRVNAVGGEYARHTAIFAYSRIPGVIGGKERTQQLFGRLSAAHIAAADKSRRSDQLLD